jgi:hypothetical protein
MAVSDARGLAAPLAAAALVGLAATLAGCASEPVSLEAHVTAAHPSAQIARPIAFVHPQAFHEQQQEIEPYSQGYVVPLKTGEASDKALREAYAQLFAAPREVGSRDELSKLAGPDAPEALLEPSIVKLNYLNASRRMEGPIYSEIVYRFDMTDAAGGPIAQWVVRGFGQYDLQAEARARAKDAPPGPRGETAILVEAPRRAIEAAAASFVRSFERVPELIRWRRGQPTAGADVAGERQATRDTAPEAPGVEASYAGAFTLRVQPTPIPKPPKDVPAEAGLELNLLALRLTLHNASAHRLALDPAEIEWDMGANASHEPLPAPVAAALITRLPFTLAVAPGTGLAALPALLAALGSAAEIDRHRTELAAWSAAVTGEMLADGVAAAGERRTGLVYFFKRPQTDGGTLVVRVVDLDDALRYTVRVPMPKP